MTELAFGKGKGLMDMWMNTALSFCLILAERDRTFSQNYDGTIAIVQLIKFRVAPFRMVYQEKLPKNIKSLFANLTQSLDVSYPLAHFDLKTCTIT